MGLSTKEEALDTIDLQRDADGTFAPATSTIIDAINGEIDE
jgi:hypothetical protein